MRLPELRSRNGPLEVHVLSREQAQAFSPTQPYALISITDPGAPPAALPADPQRRATLRLHFADLRHPSPIYPCFERKHADAIVPFVQRARRKVQTLVIHCEYGRSRSAAVAAAVLEREGRDTSWLYDAERYGPNSHVLRVMRAAR